MSKSKRDNYSRGTCLICGKVRYTDKMIWLDGHYYCKDYSWYKAHQDSIAVQVDLIGQNNAYVRIHKCLNIFIRRSANNVQDEVIRHNQNVDKIFQDQADGTKLKLTTIFQTS